MEDQPTEKLTEEDVSQRLDGMYHTFMSCEIFLRLVLLEILNLMPRDNH